MPALSFRATPTFDWTLKASGVRSPESGVKTKPSLTPDARPRTPDAKDRKLTRDRKRVAALFACQKPRARHARRVLLQGARTVLIDRLEDAIAAGAIDLHPDGAATPAIEITTGELALLLSILLPEEWPTLAPAAHATQTAPGSAERLVAYRERAGASQSLYHAADASPTRGDVDGRLVAAGKLALLIVQRANGSGPRVVGWA